MTFKDDYYQHKVMLINLPRLSTGDRGCALINIGQNFVLLFFVIQTSENIYIYIKGIDLM